MYVICLSDCQFAFLTSALLANCVIRVVTIVVVGLYTFLAEFCSHNFVRVIGELNDNAHNVLYVIITGTPIVAARNLSEKSILYNVVERKILIGRG